MRACGDWYLLCILPAMISAVFTGCSLMSAESSMAKPSDIWTMAEKALTFPLTQPLCLVISVSVHRLKENIVFSFLFFFTVYLLFGLVLDHAFDFCHYYFFFNPWLKNWHTGIWPFMYILWTYFLIPHIAIEIIKWKVLINYICWIETTSYYDTSDIIVKLINHNKLYKTKINRFIVL